MAKRDAHSVLMASVSSARRTGAGAAAERPAGTPPMGDYAWTDKDRLPSDMDEIYEACYSAAPTTAARSLKTSAWASSNPISLVANALRRCHEDKMAVEKLGATSQFNTNVASWAKLEPEALDEGKVGRQLSVIEACESNALSSKRVLADIMVEEARKASPSGGLLKFYAALSCSVEKKTIQLQASKLATEKLRRRRREALEAATRAAAAAADAVGCRRHAGEKGPGGGPSPAKPGAWSEFDTDVKGLCVEGYVAPAHMSKVRSLSLSFSPRGARG